MKCHALLLYWGDRGKRSYDTEKASWEKGGLGKLLFFLAGAAAVGLFALLPPDTFQADMSAGLTSYLLLILQV